MLLLTVLTPTFSSVLFVFISFSHSTPFAFCRSSSLFIPFSNDSEHPKLMNFIDHQLNDGRFLPACAAIHLHCKKMKFVLFFQHHLFYLLTA